MDDYDYELPVPRHQEPYWTNKKELLLSIMEHFFKYLRFEQLGKLKMCIFTVFYSKMCFHFIFKFLQKTHNNVQFRHQEHGHMMLHGQNGGPGGQHEGAQGGPHHGLEVPSGPQYQGGPEHGPGDQGPATGNTR